MWKKYKDQAVGAGASGASGAASAAGGTAGAVNRPAAVKLADVLSADEADCSCRTTGGGGSDGRPVAGLLAALSLVVASRRRR